MLENSEYLLDGNRIYHATHFEAAFFKLHHRCVINTGSLGEDENRWVCRIRYVLLKPEKNNND